MTVQDDRMKRGKRRSVTFFILWLSAPQKGGLDEFGI
jgi:hypothetical protein